MISIQITSIQTRFGVFFKQTKQLGCSMVCGFFCCCWGGGGGGGVCFKRAVSGKDGIDEAGAFC